MSAFIWNGSEKIRSRLLSRLKELSWSQNCEVWTGSQQSLSSTKLATIDTWLSPLEMSLEREGFFPPWLIGTFQVAALRLSGREGAAMIDVLCNQLTSDISRRSLENVQAMLEHWLVTRPGSPTHCRKYLPELLLSHPRSRAACDAVLTMLIQQLALLSTLRHFQPGTTTPELVAS